MFDIDIDFDDWCCGEMVCYVVDKWGYDWVVQVIIFGIIKIKVVLKDLV